MAKGSSADAPTTFAERLDRLFTTSHPAGKPELGYQEVVDALKDQSGLDVTTSYLYMLRTGRRENPSIPLIQALAKYFHVPVAYFFDDTVAADLSSQLDLLAAIRDAGVDSIALRSSDLSVESRQMLATIIERLRQADGLND